MFTLMSVVRRRYLLYYMVTMDGEVTELEQVVNAVYHHETACTDGVPQCSRESIRVDLHHTRLPQLGEVGLVDYIRRQGTIRFSEHPSLAEWIEHARFQEAEYVTDRPSICVAAQRPHKLVIPQQPLNG